MAFYIERCYFATCSGEIPSKPILPKAVHLVRQYFGTPRRVYVWLWLGCYHHHDHAHVVRVWSFFPGLSMVWPINPGDE